MEWVGGQLLLDKGLPRDAAEQLRVDGVSCAHVGELGMSTATDLEILELAGHRGAVVVTLDADFHAILAVRNASEPSVIRLRIQGLNAGSLAKLLHQVIDQYKPELDAGCMITVKQRKITCHLLPKAN